LAKVGRNRAALRWKCSNFKANDTGDARAQGVGKAARNAVAAASGDIWPCTTSAPSLRNSVAAILLSVLRLSELKEPEIDILLLLPHYLVGSNSDF